MIISFVPVSNVYYAYTSNENNFIATRLGTYYIGEKPQATDMVLLIRTAD